MTQAAAQKQPGAHGWLRGSLQLRLGLGYAAIIAALLILMNTYPLLMAQDLMFRSQQDALQKQATLLVSALATADALTPESAEGAIALMDELDAQRVVITDGAGLVLYDSGAEPATGRYALTGPIVSALRCNDTTTTRYAGGTFYSCAATPVMTRNTVVGSVCLYQEDADQGQLLEELRHNLRVISAVVCLAVLALLATFSAALTRRVGQLLRGIRTVREGDYEHRVALSGRDELAQLAQELNLLTGRLQANQAERRQFVSDASHELKTPLASIRLLTDSILQDEAIDTATTREFVADIGEATDRLIHISEDLLSLDRLDEGRVAPAAPVDLDAAVRRAVRLIGPLAQRAGVSLSTDLHAAAPVRCSHEAADQILSNLVENAVKYNVPGGSVHIATVSDGDGIVLTVADTGVGIPENELDRVFDRFYRVDKARSRAAGGTGLGLAIVRDTVRTYGGTISVRPGETAGAVFTVVLPRWTEEEVPS